ncbi:unnamed protein product, partial [marine sediment metagenome]
MVEVRFAFIGSLEGVKCTLDGEVKVLRRRRV